MKLKFQIMAHVVLLILLVHDIGAQEKIEKARVRARLFEPMINDAARRYNIDPHLLWTIAYLESRFNPRAISYKDGVPCAFGLMQFVPATAKRYGISNLEDPRQAIDGAARYLRDLMARFGGRNDLVLAAYNAGEGTVEAYRDGRRLILSNGKVVNPNAIMSGGIPPYRETRAYVARGELVFRAISAQKNCAQPSKVKLDVAVEASIYVNATRPGITGRSAKSLYVNQP